MDEEEDENDGAANALAAAEEIFSMHITAETRKAYTSTVRFIAKSCLELGLKNAVREDGELIVPMTERT